MNYYVYIVTNHYNTVVYTGVTNNLVRRVNEHRSRTKTGFTEKYSVHKLVYYEITNSIKDAIYREKQIKGWKREKKNSLINENNPEWKDLYNEICLL